jgi:hypothetical protein
LFLNLKLSSKEKICAVAGWGGLSSTHPANEIFNFKFDMVLNI